MDRPVTLVFTDVVNSTATKREASLGLDDSERDRVYFESIQSRHLQLVRDCLASRRGSEVMTIGDAFFLTFEEPSEAILCARDIQKRLREQPIQTPRGPLQLRIGIHVGTPKYFENSWHGTDVDIAARVEAVGSGGQIVLTKAAKEIALSDPAFADVNGLKFLLLGDFALKGVGKMPLWEANWDGSALQRPAVLNIAGQRRKRTIRYAVYSLLPLLIAAAWFWNYKPVRKRHAIAVLGFRNLSGRPETAWISTALGEMLTTELAAGEKVRTIPGENVARMKSDLSLPELETYAPETLEKIRGNSGADEVVEGAYLDLGGKLRLDLNAQDTFAPHETVAAVAENGSEVDLAALVSKAGAELRNRLGMGSVTRQQAQNIQAARPGSEEALRLYAEGLGKLRQFDTLGTRDSLQKAVAADPTYPLAHSELASAWASLGYDAKAREEAKRGFDLSSGLSQEERLLVEGQYRETTREWDKAIAAYRQLYKLHPDSIDDALLIAAAQNGADRSKETIPFLEQLKKSSAGVSDDPRVGLDEADAYGRLGDFKAELKEATAAFTRAQKMGAKQFMAAAQLDLGLAEISLGMGQQATAHIAAARQTYQDTGNRGKLASAVLDNALALSDAGQYKDALSATEQALSVAREIGDLRNVQKALNIESFIASYQGNMATMASVAREAIPVAEETGNGYNLSVSLGNLAGALADLGDLAGAKQAAQRGLDVSRRIADRVAIDDTAGNLGVVLQLEGDLAGARIYLQEALQAATESGSKVNIAGDEAALGNLEIDAGHAGKGESLARQSLVDLGPGAAPGDQVTSQTVLIRSLVAQGKIAQALKEADAAKPMLSGEGSNGSNAWELRIVCDRARASSSEKAIARAALADLEIAIAQTKKNGMLNELFDAQLAQAEGEMLLGEKAAARAHLALLQRNAEAKGFQLMAHKASAAMHSA